MSQVVDFVGQMGIWDQVTVTLSLNLELLDWSSFRHWVEKAAQIDRLLWWQSDLGQETGPILGYTENS